MQNSNAVKFVPVFGDDKKVELTLDGDQTVITLSKWEEGLGWCGQKTMALDAEMLDEMHRLISAARTRIKNQKIADSGPSESHKVLQFPNFA